MRLFDDGETIPLRLISSETFETGVLNLVYGPAGSTGDATHEDARAHPAQPEQYASPTIPAPWSLSALQPFGVSR